MMWNPFKKSKPKFKTESGEAIQAIKRLGRRIQVPANFDEMDFDVDFVGSTEYVRVNPAFTEGVAYWKDEQTESGVLAFRNLWEKDTSLQRHLHAEENEHLVILDGVLEVYQYDRNGVVDHCVLSRDNPYLRIPAGVPHFVRAAERSEFIVSFVRCQRSR